MAFQMNDMTKPVKDRLGFDPASVKKLTFGELIKKIGPGIILTGIVIGPGNITTSAMMGANYGYKMLWLLIPIILMGITFTLSSYRISIMTGLPILHAIRHYYGGIASGFCGVALFLSCFFFTLGNITVASCVIPFCEAFRFVHLLLLPLEIVHSPITSHHSICRSRFA